MSEARQGKEIVLEMKNKTGLLFEISRFLAEKGVSILSVAAAVFGDNGSIRLVTDDNLRTMDVLTEKGFAPKEEDAILMELPHKPGVLRRVTEVLADENVDIQFLHATVLDEHEKCLVVLHTANDQHAIPLLNRTMAT